MFKTRYTVTTDGPSTVVRRVGKSSTSVVARRIPLAHSEIGAPSGPETAARSPRPKRKARRAKG
jgi:hypothetical protein